MLIICYAVAAFAEISGCFSFWAWLKMGRSPLWIFPGVGCLMLFAWLLTWSSAEHAGRAYAAYGGIYIIASFVWMWGMEKTRPELTDVIGSILCLIGAGVILHGSKG